MEVILKGIMLEADGFSKPLHLKIALIGEYIMRVEIYQEILMIFILMKELSKQEMLVEVLDQMDY